MRSLGIAAFAATIAIALASAPGFCQSTLGAGNEKPAQGASESAPGGSISSQPGAGTPVAPGIAGQGTEPDSTLEIGPQYGGPPRAGKVDVIPNERLQPGSESASVQRNFESGRNEFEQGQARSGPRPYIGITVRYTTTCYLGREEHGLEIMTVDPNSPAQKAGLHGPTRPSAVGAAGVTAGSLLGPLALLTTPLLAKAGALGEPGDMIVAVDDHRVRTEEEFQRALARMKPGDTTYLTVIRPTPGGHKTLKLAVHLGSVHYANAGGGSGSAQNPSSIPW